MNCTTAHEMWSKLHSVYDLKSEESLALVQKQFFEFKWSHDGGIAHHISSLEQLANKMDKLGGKIPKSMLITRILSTLPTKFNFFHSAWDSTEQSKRTLENLTTRLLTEELRFGSQENVEDESKVALVSGKFAGKKNRFGKSSSADSVTRCSLCRKNNHTFKDWTENWTKRH
ncbi:uncharacterized protein LOC130900545 [Diorhabda carinulata]|uniref:uncharacterized protein LOC130900545 n=1 Tax=Diorhabda carinulata TaxID=1163345 RepID=UPI0025A0E9F4|nr:uncharacterized protein LOC130900545 [Diorhabda carinulata]